MDAAPNILPMPAPRRFTPPTLEMVELQAAKIGLPPREAQKFHAYYDSVGWVVGKARTPMKQWLSALQGWKLRWEERNGQVKGALRESVPTWSKIRNLEDIIAAKEKAMPGLANRWVDGEQAYQRDLAAREAHRREIAGLRKQLNELKEQQCQT